MDVDDMTPEQARRLVLARMPRRDLEAECRRYEHLYVEAAAEASAALVHISGLEDRLDLCRQRVETLSARLATGDLAP